MLVRIFYNQAWICHPRLVVLCPQTSPPPFPKTNLPPPLQKRGACVVQVAMPHSCWRGFAIRVRLLNVEGTVYKTAPAISPPNTPPLTPPKEGNFCPTGNGDAALEIFTTATKEQIPPLKGGRGDVGWHCYILRWRN